MTHDFFDIPPRPTPPEAPDDSECCRSGCEPCIFDLHAQEMERYRAALKAWEDKYVSPSSHDKI